MNSQNGDPRNRPDDDVREAELRRLFAERRQRDEAASPGYERLRNRPARARGGRWWTPVPWAGALLLLAVVLAVVWRLGSAPPRVPPGGRPTIETWKAPTDFLLAVPGGELLDSTPTFPDPNLPTLQGGSGSRIPSSSPRRL
jgi:hypothetical protein